MTTDEMTTTETEDQPPTAEQIADAAKLLASLPAEDRRVVARSLAPPEPGSDGKPLTPEQSRALLMENPEKWHALFDAQLAGGPRLIEGV